MSLVVPQGTLWIRPANKKSKLEVRCLLGPDAIQVIDGYAQWQTIARPKRRAITEWTGTNPLKVSISFVIDYTGDTAELPGLRCERDIRDLEEMAGLNFDGDVRPPELVWDANAPHDNSQASHLTWIIVTLTWGDVMYNTAGNKVRQAGTMELSQFVADEFITATGSGKNRKKTGASTKLKKKSRYLVKKSDKDLKQIAQNELGNANLWTEIAKLNGLRSPKRSKKWPKYLKMPPKS